MSPLWGLFMCGGESYTLFNTLAYALIFLAALSGVVRLIGRLGLSIGRDFYLAAIPLLLAGPTVRVLLDAGFYKEIAFPPSCLALNTTFGISLVLLAVAVMSMLLSEFLGKKGFGFYRSFGALNLLAFFAYHALYFGSAGGAFFRFSLLAAAGIFAYGFAASLLFYLFARRFWGFFLDARNFLLVVVHLFDASTTFVGMGMGYSEQQVLPSLLMGALGPYALFAVKLLVVPATVYYLRTEKDRDLLYFAVFLLGFAPAARNFLRIVLGV